jgi:hypothetical protein
MKSVYAKEEITMNWKGRGMYSTGNRVDGLRKMRKKFSPEGKLPGLDPEIPNTKYC